MHKQYNLYIDQNRRPDKFFDLLRDPIENQELLDSPHSPKQTKLSDKLTEVVASWPSKDSDPSYVPNHPQDWDIEIGAESQVWKK